MGNTVTVTTQTGAITPSTESKKNRRTSGPSAPTYFKKSETDAKDLNKLKDFKAKSDGDFIQKTVQRRATQLLGSFRST